MDNELDANQQKYKEVTPQEAHELWECGVSGFEDYSSSGVWHPSEMANNGVPCSNLRYRVPVE